MRFILSFDDFLKKLSVLDFVPLFLIRVYLFFVFWFAGVDKIENLEKFSGYLGALGVPLPDLASWLVIILSGGCIAISGSFCKVGLITFVVMFLPDILFIENGWPHEANGMVCLDLWFDVIYVVISGGGKYMSLDYWVLKKINEYLKHQRFANLS